MKKFIVIVSLLSSSAFADICGIVTLDQGEKTLSFLTKGAKITQTYAAAPELVVKQVNLKKTITMDNVDYYDLVVNGQPVDPGHTNIVINENVSLNLGKLVGCDSESSDPNWIIPTSISSLEQAAPISKPPRKRK